VLGAIALQGVRLAKPTICVGLSPLSANLFFFH